MFMEIGSNAESCGPLIGIIEPDVGASLLLELRDSLQRQVCNNEKFGGY
jgi:hypothetical protein